RYAHDHFGAEKFRVFSTLNASHGRTFFTVTAGGQAKYATGFGPTPTGFTHIRYNDIAGLEAAFDEEGGDDICAVILEPMQGEGGMIPGTPEFLTAARRLCDEHDALLIFDEIQSGMGRTGAGFSPTSAAKASGSAASSRPRGRARRERSCRPPATKVSSC